MKICRYNLIIIHIYFIIFSRPEQISSEIEELEESIIVSLYGSSVKSHWIDIDVNGQVWKTHYLQSFRNSTSEQQTTVVLLHGYGATSTLAWRRVLPRIIKKYDVYAIDMPGFGRSIAPDTLLFAQNEETILRQYCAFYARFLDVNHISDPYVVAHSFGAFMITHCASRWPQRVSRLLLADVPGFFPMNGGWDFAWASLYTFGLPQTALRLVGSWAYSIAKNAAHLIGVEMSDEYVRYWLRLQTGREMRSELISNKFLRHRGIYAIGTTLALVPLLQIVSFGVPVGLVYGTADSITPLHQGRMVRELTGLTLFEIPGAGHVPYLSNDGQDFAEAIHKAELLPAVTKRPADACCFRTNSRWTNFPCLPIMSNYVLEWLYDTVRNIHARCGTNGPRESEDTCSAEVTK